MNFNKYCIYKNTSQIQIITCPNGCSPAVKLLVAPPPLPPRAVTLSISSVCLSVYLFCLFEVALLCLTHARTHARTHAKKKKRKKNAHTLTRLPSLVSFGLRRGLTQWKWDKEQIKHQSQILPPSVQQEGLHSVLLCL